jgi:hypothetical protein
MNFGFCRSDVETNRIVVSTPDRHFCIQGKGPYASNPGVGALVSKNALFVISA